VIVYYGLVANCSMLKGSVMGSRNWINSNRWMYILTWHIMMGLISGTALAAHLSVVTTMSNETRRTSETQVNKVETGEVFRITSDFRAPKENRLSGADIKVHSWKPGAPSRIKVYSWKPGAPSRIKVHSWKPGSPSRIKVHSWKPGSPSHIKVHSWKPGIP